MSSQAEEVLAAVAISRNGQKPHAGQVQTLICLSGVSTVPSLVHGSRNNSRADQGGGYPQSTGDMDQRGAFGDSTWSCERSRVTVVSRKEDHLAFPLRNLPGQPSGRAA